MVQIVSEVSQVRECEEKTLEESPTGRGKHTSHTDDPFSIVYIGASTAQAHEDAQPFCSVITICLMKVCDHCSS